MPDRDEIISLLKQNDTFVDVPAETLEQLADGAEERQCDAGETLIEQGVRCGDLFLATAGDFAVTIRDSDQSSPREVARLGHGRVFGEIGAVSGIGATATVQAVDNGTVLVISGDHFHRVMKSSPKLAESVLRSMSRYLAQ